MTTSVRVDGIPEMLAELKKIDPELRKQAVRDIKAVGPRIVATARGYLPNVPLSGWTVTGPTDRVPGKVPPYYLPAARRGIKTRFRGSGSRNYGKTYRLLTLVQQDGAGAVYDMAGRRSMGRNQYGRWFIAGLNRGNGRASRTMWKAVERHRPDIELNVQQAARKMQAEINRRTTG